MRSRLVLILAAAAAVSAPAQVRYAPDTHTVTIGGKPFTTFHYGEDANKPFLAPVRSASGKIITRGFPMENIPGESRDHLHHRGLWFSYDDVNGVKFWENDPSYTKPHIGKIVVQESHWKGGGATGTLSATMHWNDPKGQTLLVETRDMVFYDQPSLRTIDFHITLTAAVPVTLGDTKEGAFAIRLVEPFTERKGARIVNAEGLVSMKNVWGKRSAWVDYEATVDGEPLGVAMFDHPSNPRYPTYWHARDYGLFALDPFGRAAFDPSQEESQWKLAQGDKISFLWRVVVHPGNASVADLYQAFASK
ncbi:MAG: PmoA family protein [Acidobacteriota bacterium]|nr:PmoA family protein [Acidobacteriota bacterium]